LNEGDALALPIGIRHDVMVGLSFDKPTGTMQHQRDVEHDEEVVGVPGTIRFPPQYRLFSVRNQKVRRTSLPRPRKKMWWLASGDVQL
jgi:hypothetical protein